MLYTIDKKDWDYLERVWAFAQYYDCNMYKTRLGPGNVQWVIDVPDTSITSRFLLEFSHNVTHVNSV